MLATPPGMSAIGSKGTTRLPAWVIPGRSARVVALSLVVLVLSLADLALTLTFLTSVGMAEENPIARLVIGTGSAWVVVAFKMGLSLTACGIFWLARGKVSGEVGAWAGVLLMAWLMVRWQAYIEHSHHFTGVLVGQEHPTDARWVALGAE